MADQIKIGDKVEVYLDGNLVVNDGLVEDIKGAYVMLRLFPAVAVWISPNGAYTIKKAN